MIERIKEQLWKLLGDKKVSLAMIYADDGEILWHRGRAIQGRRLMESSGLCKMTAFQAIEKNVTICSENCLIRLTPPPISDSGRLLNIKSMLIIPMANKYFLYLDSGTSNGFSERDIGAFEILATILSEIFKTLIGDRDSDPGKSTTSRYHKELNEKVIRYAIEEEPVLLLGKTGVGKNRVGEMIHRYSGRKGNFVVAHCPTIPEPLFESEIFGHKKGSFTGADRDKKGLLSQAECGTLFIDEISDVPLSFQSKLLRFIEDKTCKALGENKEQKIDVRIIAASNKDLVSEIKRGRFRDDLFFRLNTLSIHIPPLKERKDDIYTLVNEYSSFLRGKEIDAQGWQVLLDHDWPGNVRELISVLKRIGIDFPGNRIGAEIDSIIQMGGCPAMDHDLPPAKPEPVSLAWNQMERGKNFWDVVWKPFISDREFNRHEVHRIIKEAYDRSGGNFKRTTRILGIPDNDYKKFIAYLHKYDLHPAG